MKITKAEYKRFAKDACKENGIKVFMKNMILLETGVDGFGCIDYVMFEDTASGKEYQCTFSGHNYTDEHPNCFGVQEYIERG